MLQDALKWQTVKNTVSQRLSHDSLLNTLESRKKIKKRTKLINKKLRRCRVVDSYGQYVKIKKEVDKECNNNAEETEDEEEETLGYEGYKKIHAAKPKNQIRKFLKLCKKPIKRPPQRIVKLSPKKSPVKRTKSERHSETKTTPKPSPPIPRRSLRKIGSQPPRNRSRSDVRRVDEEDEKLKVKKIVDNLIATDYDDNSPESVSKNTESSERRIDSTTGPNDERLNVFGDFVREDYDADVRDHSIAASQSPDDTEGRLESVKDGSITIDEILDVGEVVDDKIEEEKFPDASIPDSGNESPSEVEDVVPEATESDDRVVILPDDLSELEKSVLRLNGLSKNVKFDKESSISWLDLRHERHMTDDVVSESDLDSGAVQQVESFDPIINSQTGDETVGQNAVSNNKSKVKIRTIERFENGRNILSKYRSPNLIEKTFEEKLTSDIRDSSKNSELSNAELKPQEEFSVVDELPEVQSRRRNLSANSDLSSKSYDEALNNSVKMQLLSEIDQRLADSPSSKKRRSSDSESSRLSKPSAKRALFDAADIDELFDNEVLEEETEFDENGSNCSRNHSECSARSVNTEVDASRKRRISKKTAAEPSMLDALRSKKQGRYHNKVIRDLGWLPCEPEFPEAGTQEFESSKNKDDELTRKKRPKKVRRLVKNPEEY